MTRALGTYSFLPYLRNGIGRVITAADSPSVTALRASLPVTLNLVGTGVSGPNVTQDISKTIELYGPGDIVGIDKREIIRMEPRPWSTNAETPYLAHIEFYDEDFCWRYTPAAPTEMRLRPWITLIVLAEGEFVDGGIPEPKTLPYIELPDDQTIAQKFPPADQLWAWAHVHVNGNLTSSETTIVSDVESDIVSRLRAIIGSDPDLAYSRLICPRKLGPNTGYHAFVIPTFEPGRLAALGRAPELAPSVTHSAWEDYPSGTKDLRNRFPYFHRWYFRTGGPDFEALVRCLVPRPVDSRVGTRDVDLTAPGSNLPGLRKEELPLNGVLRLGGALKVPDSNFSDAEKQKLDIYENWCADYPHELQANLAQLLNLADEYKASAAATVHGRTRLLEATDDGDCDPVVTPPIYGQWHALATRLLTNADGSRIPNDQNWLHQLNLDPRHRIAAGLGTAVMIREQERFMQASWAQVGAVLEANRRIRLAQLAKQTAWSWFHKQLKPLHNVDKARALQIAAPMQLRVMIAGKTMRGSLLESRLQPAAVSVVARRAFRPMPRVNRFVQNPKRLQALFQGVGSGAIRTVPAKAVPKAVVTMGKLAPGGSGLTAAVAHALGIGTERISASSLDALPRSATFAVGTDVLGGARGGTTDSPEATRFKSAMKNAYAMIDESFALSAPVSKKQVDVTQLAGSVINALDPARTFPQRIRQRVKIPQSIDTDMSDDPMVEALAYPVIDEPLYKPLIDISPELLLPNINLIPPNSLTLLETNRPFIEAVCVGANHEWAREALWQEYPTDQRGSPLRQFWAVADTLEAASGNAAERENLRDIKPIDKWKPVSTLGGHDPGVEGDDTNVVRKKEDIVLAVRGDLLRLFPTAVIMAHRAAWQMSNGRIIGTGRVLAEISEEEDANPPRSKVRTPRYEAKVEPDIYFFAFDLTEEEVKGGTGENPTDDPGWFFLIKERPGELRLGLDEGSGSALEVWNDLSWQHIQPGPAGSFIQIPTNTPALRVLDDPLETDDQEKEEQRRDDELVEWGSGMTAAEVAYILFQAPVLIAVHASEMLKGGKTRGIGQ